MHLKLPLYVTQSYPGVNGSIKELPEGLGKFPVADVKEQVFAKFKQSGMLDEHFTIQNIQFKYGSKLMEDDKTINYYDGDPDGELKDFEINVDFTNVIALKFSDSDKYKFISYTKDICKVDDLRKRLDVKDFEKHPKPLEKD